MNTSRWATSAVILARLLQRSVGKRRLQRTPHLALNQSRPNSTGERNKKLIQRLMASGNFNPFERVTEPENEAPNLKEFTSNANHNVALHKFNRLRPVAPSDSSVSCTVFDDKGNNISVSKKYPKMQFLKENNLFPRDLRQIDTSSIDVAPQIMVRSPNTILINLLHIKALIKNDRVMIFDTATPEVATKLGLFIYDLEAKLKAPSSYPYEFRALESILINVMGYLEAELRVHSQACGQILSELENQVDRRKLQDLLIKAKKVQAYHQKALLIRNALEDLLDNDDDLAAMYLTVPRSTAITDFSEIEDMLESYYKQCDECVQQAGSLVSDIKSTEDIVNIILDTNRNNLMLFELKVTIYTLGITVATLLPAFYGMNLKNFIEESEYGFGAIILLSIIQGILITIVNFQALHKVQKITMMGGTSHRNILKLQPSQKLPSRKPSVSNLWHKKTWWSSWKKPRPVTKYYHPNSRERDHLWRILHDNKTLK